MEEVFSEMEMIVQVPFQVCEIAKFSEYNSKTTNFRGCSMQKPGHKRCS